MDKRSVLGIVLIVLITLTLPYYQKWVTGNQPPVQEKILADSTRINDLKKDSLQRARQSVAPAPTETPVESTGGTRNEMPPLEITSASKEVRIEIDSPLLKVVLSSRHGGNPVKWELKKYAYYLGGQVNLADNNGFDVDFTNRDGKRLKLSEFNLYTLNDRNRKIILNEKNPRAEISFYLPVKDGRIVKKMVFYYDKYSADVIVKFQKLSNYIINRRYLASWRNGLPLTEEDQIEDSRFSRAYAYMAGDLEDLDVSDEKGEQKNLNGRVDWAAIRNKYFVTAIVPRSVDKTNGVILSGSAHKTDKLLKKKYELSLDIPYQPAISQVDSFIVYTGPLDNGILKSYGVGLQTLIMNNGWYERIFRVISLLLLPVLQFMHKIIPNYGIVIIIFCFLIKLVLHPLTKKSYQSMGQMQTIQPIMAEMKEKYKGDPQRMNKEMMKLYKEHGVNPLGGCLPMMLQMPLLISLYSVFRSTIQLRDQPFMLWITDLSRPDTLHLGFALPVIGASIHILPILMAVSQIWQSKMTMSDPKQKAMIYLMPLMMLFFFYSLPSGLNLYYFIFNVLSMAQMKFIKKKTPEVAPVPVKSSAAKAAAAGRPRKSGRK